MIPLSDQNPTLRTPVVTVLILISLGACWVLLQGAGLSNEVLVRSVCELGFVPGEFTRLARVGSGIPLGEVNGRLVSCVVDRDPINVWTPLISMFLHGGWLHLLGNSLYLWVFGNNIEDSLGRLRFPVFYVLCGLVAAAAQALVDPASPVPMVGASGAISGVMGAYLILYPRVRVNILPLPFWWLGIISVPAWTMLIFWFGTQVLEGLPALLPARTGAVGGVAVWAHIGGFVAGMVLVKLMRNRELTERRFQLRRPPRRGYL
ncbi:MAG TPA: rhomboid family intramembrane serine protease [Myxococcales bacterium]|jgi:membrane associated rhomboid family serine protease|nr:rhomboid family intramembrane serine protease [Myxococcales bacterium]